MGDWGGSPSSPYYTTDEKDTATIMGQIADNHDISFAMGLGDNFYDSGIPTDVNDPRFKQVWFKKLFVYCCHTAKCSIEHSQSNYR